MVLIPVFPDSGISFLDGEELGSVAMGLSHKHIVQNNANVQ